MKSKIAYGLALILFTLFIASTVYSETFYVRTDGSFVSTSPPSWTNAFSSINGAVSWANGTPGNDEIWVMAGTYNGAVQVSALGVSNSVAIYGGFSSTTPEASIDQTKKT